jgi:hypothetical protein
MDHTNSIQRLYDLINAGDIDGFADLAPAQVTQANDSSIR